MMIEVSYRPATIGDCHEIVKLKGEVWNTTYRGIYSDDTLANYDVESNERTFVSIVNSPKMSLNVAMDAGKIIGFISCGEPYRPYLYYKQDIGLLYILQDYQGLGIGKTLFSLAKNQILKNGHKEFFVSVNKYNQKAIDFYIAMGGVVIHVDEDMQDKRAAQMKLIYKV